MSVDADLVDAIALKQCSQCGVEKSLDDFYDHKTNKDGKFNKCKECVLGNRKAKYNNRKQEAIEQAPHLDRVEKFVKGLLDTSELSDAELQGRYILDDNGKPHQFAHLENRPGNRIVAKLNKELSSRINEYIKSKSPRAVQVIFEIADSDMVEPADRLKAATWLAERVIGKQPEILLTAKTEVPYESILDSIQSGSREDYRKQVESTRLVLTGGQPDSPMDVEEVEISEDEDGDHEISEPEGNSGSHSVGVGGSGLGSGTDHSQGSEGTDSVSRPEVDGSESSGVVDSTLQRVNDAEKKRVETAEAKKRMQKAKARRYAARANGNVNATNLAFLVDYRVIKSSGNFHMKLILPEDQTASVVDKVLARRAV